MDEEKKDQEQEKAEPEAKEEEKTEEKKEPDGAPDDKKEEPAVKTFTQEEVNRIVRERVARASKDTQVMAAENTALKNSIACYKAADLKCQNAICRATIFIQVILWICYKYYLI